MNLYDDHLKKFKISFRQALAEDFDTMIEITDDYYHKLNLDKVHLNKNNSPWIWISESNVYFELMSLNEQVVGFFISRQVPLNNHLHSFFIDKRYRGFGLGKKLILRHWRKALEQFPDNDTFTLHVNKINKFAADFYKKFGYKKIKQEKELLLLNDGLGSWARNCETKDQWPLKRDMDLYFVKVDKVRKDIS